MNEAKMKATDFVVESLKLIVTLSTIILGGLLAYRATLVNPSMLGAYYSSLIALAISAILSVANINSLINKIFREDEDAIQHKEAKTLNVLATLALLIGIVSAALFLSNQPIQVKVESQSSNTVITDTQIIIGNETQSNIEVKKNNDGKIDTVVISPKAANK